MDTVVLKFGGSSVANVEKIQKVADQIIDKKKNFKNIVVVVSAMGDTTDNLIEIARDISPNPSKREMDVLMSTGEQISISLLSMAIIEKGHKAISLTGFQAGFKTQGYHTEAKIEDVHTERVRELLEQGYIIIVAGFQGMNSLGDITTLGRGGSDTSAVALASKLDGLCEIYTDVKGIYTVDPRIFPEAKKLDRISYEEGMEMANLGASVIASRAVELAFKHKVPLYIALSGGEKLGTYIEGGNMEKNTITNISCINDILLVHISNNNMDISALFEKMAQHNINIDVISINILEGKNITFSTVNKNKGEIKEILEKEGLGFELIEGVSKVSIIGDAMRNQTGIAGRAFHVFKEKKIPFYQVSTSEISISYIIDYKYREEIIHGLAKEFNL